MSAAPEVWWSIVLGGLMGLCYVGASVFVTRLARRTRHFVPVILGGMLVRMTLALGGLLLLTLVMTISLPALTASFLCVFLVGLGVEVAWILRHD